MKNALKTTTLALLATTALVTSAVANKHHHDKHNKHHKFTEPTTTPAPCNTCNDSPSTGLYVGGVVGQQKIDMSMRADTKNTGEVGRTSLFGLNDRSFVGGVMVGYGLEWMNMYWGLEADALFGETKSKALLNYNSSNTLHANVMMKTGNAFGSALRVGKNFCGNLVYARFGIEGRRFAAEMTHTNNAGGGGGFNASQQVYSTKKTKLAFVPGVGFELPVVSGLSARLEVREAFYESGSKTSASGQSKLKWRKPAVSSVMVGFTYKTGLLEMGNK